MNDSDSLKDIIFSVLKNKINIIDNNKIIIKKIDFFDDTVSIILEIAIEYKKFFKEIENLLSIEIQKKLPKSKLSILITSHNNTEEKDKFNNNQKINIEKIKTPNIKKIIAVGSGKGGVGKSTIAANIALSLQKMGKKVGLLDADMYGPSQQKIFNINEKMETLRKNEREFLVPKKKYGISIISLGFMVGEDDAIVWRGPMLIKALKQFINQVDWGELDFLIVDLPPGTGDIQLTLSQKFDLNGAIIVSTPQDLALIDAKKAIKMFEKVNISVLGLIENMSYYECPKCGFKEKIFGSNGVLNEANSKNISYLGKIPLKKEIMISADGGKPFSIFNEDSKENNFFSEIAKNIITNII